MLALEKNYITRRVSTMINMTFHPAESELDFRYKSIETTALEDLYSTTPLKIISSRYQQPDEDELHSSFEEAISDRVLAFNKRHSSISVSRIENVSPHSLRQAEISLQRNPTLYMLVRCSTRDIALLLVIAFLLILVGFDLLGLLVLLTSP
jgi:hypothetical protein